MKKKVLISIFCLISVLGIGYSIYSFIGLLSASSSGVSEVIDDTELKLLSFETESIGMKVGTTLKLPVAIEPVNAIVDELIWESSDSNIAVVDNNGVVVAIAKGKCEIIVKTSDGVFGDKIVISVEENLIDFSSLKLSNDSLELYVSETYTITAIIEPHNATNKVLRWSSSDNSIASVNNGVITAHGSGNVVITVTSKDGKYSASCNVTVKNMEKVDVEVSGVVISNSSIELKKGDTKKLSVKVMPENATDKSVVWISSNSNIVSVDNGNIVAKESGIALVSVISSDGKYKSSCEVLVTDSNSSSDYIDVVGIKLSEKDISLKVGEKFKLSVTIYPDNAKDKKISWSSSNSDVVSVDSKGNVVAKKNGTAAIIVSTADGKYNAKCNVIVKSDEATIVNVDKVVLSVGDTIRLEKGKTMQLSANVLPSEASNKEVSWSSNNNAVISVSNSGLITAIKIGTAVITVTSKDGNKTDFVEVTVYSNEPSIIAPTGIVLNQQKLILDVGKTGKIIATVQPSNATNSNIKWTSNNPAVAVVSNDGTITAKSAGATEIIASVDDIKVSASIIVNNDFEISYFLGLYAEEITREDVKMIKDLGITLVSLKSGCNSAVDQRKYMDKAIKLFAEYGIDVLVSDYQMFNLMLRKREAVNDFGIACPGTGEFCRDYSNGEMTAMLNDMINAYSSYGNVVGWDITDEPNVSEFDRLEFVVNYLNSNSSKYSYVNLFPNYITNDFLFGDINSSLSYYNNYIVPFSQRIKIPILSVDHYMEEFMNKNLWDSKVKYYVNMLNILEASRSTNKFPMNVTLATHMKEINYKAITYADLAWQNSVNLAFGMKRISYFSYKNTANNPAIVVLKDGYANNNSCANPPSNSLYNKTELYNNIMKINNTWLYALGNELYTKQLSYIYDFNDGILTQYNTVNSKGKINASATGLISLYNDGSFMLVNTETRKNNVFTFSSDNVLKGMKWFNPISRKWEILDKDVKIDNFISINLSSNTITLAAGHPVLLKK